MANNETGNSSATLLGGYNFGFYENSTQLTGSHFKDPVLVSAIVVNGMCVFSFAALAIVSWWMKGKRARGRKVFAVLYGLVVALFLLDFQILHPVYRSVLVSERIQLTSPPAHTVARWPMRLYTSMDSTF
jgi:hypothetical protein